MSLEVCVDSLESANNAIIGDADELEICSCLPEGGLTPTVGLVILIQKSLMKYHKTVKLNIMIRSRGGSDFCYSEDEINTMLEDLEYFKKLNVDSFVFGALSKNGTVDAEYCSRVIERAKPLPVSFHRAFDFCCNPFETLEALISLGFKRVLTSGHSASAGDPEAVDLIRKLKEMASGRIEIMPGAGVNLENAVTLADVGSGIVHSSCKVKRKLPRRNNTVLLAPSDSDFVFISDSQLVKAIKQQITS